MWWGYWQTQLKRRRKIHHLAEAVAYPYDDGWWSWLYTDADPGEEETARRDRYGKNNACNAPIWVHWDRNRGSCTTRSDVDIRGGANGRSTRWIKRVPRITCADSQLYILDRRQYTSPNALPSNALGACNATYLPTTGLFLSMRTYNCID
ncbi:hypothetical protein C8R44DRAFT_890653 [Mycena epipterygia]|nr:hypothetical protein C8R44DRAFT_890653 [Mycena epipterygia]